MLFLLRTLSAAASIAVLAALLTPPAPPPPPAAPEPETTTTRYAHGVVEWERGVVRVTGSCYARMEDGDVAKTRLLAERGAKLDALRNLAETIEAMPTSAGTVDDVADDDEFLEVLKAGFKVVDTKYYSDGSVDVEATLTIASVERLVAPALLVR